MTEQRIEPRGKNLAALSTVQLLVEYRRAPRISAGVSERGIKSLEEFLDEARRRDMVLDGLRSAYSQMRYMLDDAKAGTWQPVLCNDPYNDGPVWVDENGCVCWAGPDGETKRLVMHGDMRLCLFVPKDTPTP